MRRLFFIWILIPLIFSACGGAPRITATPEPESSATVNPLPTRITGGTPVVNEEILNICLGVEPNTLYPYGEPNAGALSVMQAIYDGPIDTLDYVPQAVILSKIPSIEDGDARLVPVDVKKGDLIVDSKGNLTTLDTNTNVFPSGCSAPNCAVRYDGTSALKMDQLVVGFSLLSDLTWSDGEALTANDSVFGYEMDSDSETPGSKYLVERTYSYEAVDDLNVEWWGVPGFMDAGYRDNFWAPLPAHRLEDKTAKDLLTAFETNKQPIGWGAYVLKEWVTGDHISFTKNANYFRVAEGLPAFEELNFLFVSSPEQAISYLTSGKCDVLDTTVRIEGQTKLLLEMVAQGQLQASFVKTDVMERLALGLRQASYDDGYDSAEDRYDYFGDPRLRRALALCIDRPKINEDVLFGLSGAPETLIPSEHPFFNSDVQTYGYDPIGGSDLLNSIGWIDDDEDPLTPRVAFEVPNVDDGTSLSLSYLSTNAPQRKQAAEIIIDSLRECGVEVYADYLDSAELFAPGPDGYIFGRQFDFVQFATSASNLDANCLWYASSEVPSESNGWQGVNVSGYSNTSFDLACSAMLNSLPDSPAYEQNYSTLQNIFSQELPSIPLYWRIKIGASRAGFCGFEINISALSDLWNIESFATGGDCQP